MSITETSKTFKTIISSMIMVSVLTLTACGPGLLGGVFVTLNLNQAQIGVMDQVPLQALVNNPFGHPLEFRYTADRGQIISNNPENPVATYLAPFSGGPDVIRLSVFDRFDNINLPPISQPISILGDGISYVELPQGQTSIDDTENGLIKVTGLGGSGFQPKQVATGRQPTISPDGRFLAYTFYPGDGTSQIRVQDPAGNILPLTGSHQSFNRDPTWSPVGNDFQLHLAFSSDRIQSRDGQNFDARGEQFNIWRVNVRGSDLRPVTSTPGSDMEPNWSPNGQFIVYRSNFSQNKANNFWNLWVIDANNGRQYPLTHEAVAEKGAYEPTFSPDGRRIAYSRRYLKRDPENLFDFSKIWLLNFNPNELGTPASFNQPGVPSNGQTTGGSNIVPTLPGSNVDAILNTNASFGQIATQEFDEGTVEASPSFSSDGRTITYVRQRGQEVKPVSIPSNPGNQGTIGLEPIAVQGIFNAIEVDWARQSRTFSRPFFF